MRILTTWIHIKLLNYKLSYPYSHEDLKVNWFRLTSIEGRWLKLGSFIAIDELFIILKITQHSVKSVFVY